MWLHRAMDTYVASVPTVSVVMERLALTWTTALCCHRRMAALCVEALAAAQTLVRTRTSAHASRAISLLKEHARRSVLAMLQKPTTATCMLRATTKAPEATAALAMGATLGQASSVLTRMAVRMLHASLA